LLVIYAVVGVLRALCCGCTNNRSEEKVVGQQVFIPHFMSLVGLSHRLHLNTNNGVNGKHGRPTMAKHLCCSGKAINASNLSMRWSCRPFVKD
jgi:hypothetical protein